MDKNTQLDIAFPKQEQVRWGEITSTPTSPPPLPFEEKEILEAAARLKSDNMAGPDNIAPEIAKVAATLGDFLQSGK